MASARSPYFFAVALFCVPLGPSTSRPSGCGDVVTGSSAEVSPSFSSSVRGRPSLPALLRATVTLSRVPDPAGPFLF